MVYPFHLLRQRYCNHSPLFWRGAGGEAVCFIQVYVSPSSSRAHRAIRSIRPIRVRFKNHLQSRVRLLIRALRVIRVRHPHIMCCLFYPFTLLLFYPFKSNHSPLFWKGAGGEALISLLERGWG